MITINTKKQILNGLVGRNDSFGNSLYVGLSSTAPKADGTEVTEPTVGGYGRVLIGYVNQSVTQKFNAAVEDAETGDVYTTNNSELYFPESTGSWGATLTHFAIFTSATGGTPIAYGELTDEGVAAPVNVTEAKTVVMFRPGKLKIKFTAD